MSHRNNYRNLDITGKRYGKLVAIKKIENLRTTWLLKCDCGNEVKLNVCRVLHGQLSCGCYLKECVEKWAKSHTTHGATHTKLYHKYRSIIDRCYNSATLKYKRYGGRGIYVCDEWKNSFQAFKDWAYATGYDPNLDGRTEQSIDRIDNNGPYSPENCRWTTAKEQMRNREITKVYPYHGEMYTASEFADNNGIYDKSFVYRRIKERGMSLEEILNDWKLIHYTPDHLVTSAEYAKKCGVTITTVNRWVKTGKVKFQKVGKFNYIDIREE